ncbi:Nucleotide-diphospho-sugar transferase [Dillenia turbinata]|uniref:Nucleotide-diphospho-sugar transferase n=1 Tax=Dillenia turbinata TaxID=194707 RepID=A0AAN8V5U8_9MAGN
MNLTASGRGRRVAFQRRRFPATMLRSTSSNLISGDMPPNTIFGFRRALSFSVFVVAVVLSCFVLHKGTLSFDFFSLSSALYSRSKFVFPELNDSEIVEYRIEKVLKDAAMEDRTVILTTLNEAWAAPGSIIDLFLESFRIGDRTHRLLNHLVIVALDQKAYSRCLVLHIHCVAFVTEGVDFSREAYFMTSDYLKMMWRRIDFLRSVLEMGYNFVFTSRKPHQSNQHISDDEPKTAKTKSPMLVYSRKNRPIQHLQQAQSLEPEPVVEMVSHHEPEIANNDLQSFTADESVIPLDHNIALRKGIRQCTQHSISNFISCHHISPQHQSFLTSLNSIMIPRIVGEVLRDRNWTLAMKEEVQALEKNKTWEIVTKLENVVPFGYKWVYTLKATLVAKGYTNKFESDCPETFVQARFFCL